jgi:iron complex outermembrane receptor protein
MNQRTNPRRSARMLASVALLSLSFAAARAADTGTITITVEMLGGGAAEGARVTLVELRRSRFTDAAGKVAFDDIPPGAYHVQAYSQRFGESVDEIELAAGGNVEITLVLGFSGHRERIVVTATRTGRGSAELVMPVQVLDETALSEKLQPTIGETLSSEPGVSSNYFAPGASRPVIRGQGGDRIRVLEDGFGVGDASTTSPDHAVATDAIAADQIEILRGPATLLYGSSALGGVVNILDQRIPEHAPHRLLGGSVNLRYGSAADEKSGAAVFNGRVGSSFAYHVDALDREADDYDIPGRAVLGDPASPVGTLFNSSLESQGATVGASWVGESGFLGVSAKTFDTNYGIPAELEEEPPPPGFLGAPPPAGVRIDLEQKRYDLRGGLDRRFGPFDGVRFGIGTTDYEHRELEGAEVGTTFFNDSDEARFEMTHGHGGGFRGVFGVQYATRDFEAVGLEAFLPPSETESLALFALEEIEAGPLRYEIGARFDSTDLTTPATLAPDPGCAAPVDRDFDEVSGSVGAVWSPNDTYTLGGSVSRTVRPPSAEELYSCGEHVATLSFEIGDPNLREEQNLGVDVSLRRTSGRVTGELNLFGYSYDDYIYEEDTGATEPPMDPDGLPVFAYAQADAEFYGAEATALIELLHTDGHDFDLEVGADFVRAELADTNEPLPRIPPARGRLGLHYRGARWHASAGVTHHDDQDRNAPSETQTEGYTMVDASVGYRLVTKGLVHDLTLRGSNLTDEEARNHPSRLKDLVPLPGVDVAVIYRLIF